MTSTTPPPIGRVRLSDIAEEWSRTQALNPLLLAAEVAGVLRTLAPDGQPLGNQHYSLAVFDLSTGAGGITYRALADYFDTLGSGQPSDCIDTTIGSIRVGTVLLAHTFFSPIVAEAINRAATAAGFIAEALPSQATIGSTQRQIFQPEPPPGSSPEVLAAHQIQLRQEGEQSAGELLEAERNARQHLEASNTKLSARLAVAETQLRQAQETAEEARSQLNEERRARLLAEAQAVEEAEARATAEARAADAEAELSHAPAKIAESFAEIGRLISASQWFTKPATNQSSNNHRPYLLTIAGLLSLLLDRQRSNYNQGSAAKAIAQKGWHGAGERQVNELFAKAKVAAKDAGSDALAKAMEVQGSNSTQPHQD